MRKLFLLILLLIAITGKSFSQFNWEHTNGPPGAILAYLYTNEKYAFVPQLDFLFRTPDAMHWEKVLPTQTGHLAIHKDTIISPFWDSNLEQMRLQISTDNGDHWLIRDVPDEILNYGSIAICKHGIYWRQSGNRGLFHSTDLGVTWDTIPQHLSWDYDLNVFDERLYASDLLTMWRTDEHGENWEEIILPNASVQHQYMTDFVVRDSNIILTTEEDIFHSHDQGKTWNRWHVYSANSHDKLTLAGNAVYADIYDTFLRSEDFGFHWDTLAIEDYPSFIDLGGLRDTFLATTYNQGVFRWDEATQQCIESNDGLSKGYIYDLAYGANKIWAACGNGVFSYDIPSDNWGPKMNLPYPKFEYGSVSANEEGWVVASEIYSNAFYFSEDFGLTWDTIHTENTIDKIQLLNHNIFINSDFFGAYRSIDKGMHWDQIHVSLGDFVPFQGKIYSGGYDLFFTADDGLTWQSQSCPFHVNRLHAFGDQLFAMTIDTAGFLDLYISGDGQNWTHAQQGLPLVYGIDFFDFEKSFFFRDAGHYFAFLGNEGSYWTPIGEIAWSPIVTPQGGNDWILHDQVLYLGDHGMDKAEITDPYIVTTEEIPAENSCFIFYPTSTSDFLNIVPTYETDRSFVAHIFSTDGKLLLIKACNVGENLSISSLTPGIYFLEVSSLNCHSFCKILKI